MAMAAWCGEREGVNEIAQERIGNLGCTWVDPTTLAVTLFSCPGRVAGKFGRVAIDGCGRWASGDPPGEGQHHQVEIDRLL
jgi:hypothetical protein